MTSVVPAWKNVARKWSNAGPNTSKQTLTRPSVWKTGAANARNFSPIIPRLPPAWRSVAKRCESALRTVKAGLEGQALTDVVPGQEALEVAGLVHHVVSSAVDVLLALRAKEVRVDVHLLEKTNETY
jgi:hypothetical protein